MKKYALPFIALILSACASTNTNNISTNSRLGHITDKQTIVTQSRHALPIDLGVGFGGGHWGLNLGLGQLLSLGQTSNTVFQYTIKVGANESLSLQSAQDFSVGSCLTVLERVGDRDFPQIQGNPNCQKPVAQ